MSVTAKATAPRHTTVADAVFRAPPTTYFLVSAVFHYLGPACAVLLFTHVDVLGVAWLRIASAAVVFALWRRPWHIWTDASRTDRQVLLALGVVLAAMNTLFYLAVDRLPLATVGAIEFLGTVVLAAAGTRTRRNALALVLATGGVAVLTQVRITGEPWGFVFAFANCLGFMAYVVLGHRIANSPAPSPREQAMAGVDRLGLVDGDRGRGGDAARSSAGVPAFAHPEWLLWGIGVGLCSSVIPYVTDQLAMARLSRATFALDAGTAAGDRHRRRAGRAGTGAGSPGSRRGRTRGARRRSPRVAVSRGTWIRCRGGFAR